MSETSLTRKLDTPLKMKVLAMMARGEKYGTIQRILKDDHGIDYDQSSLSYLRKKHKDVIIEMEGMILDAETSEAAEVRAKALRQLGRKLDQAAGDELELAKLDEEYRTTEMTLSEYRRKKAGLLKMSVNELVLITEKMHTQSGAGKRGAAAPMLPGGGSSDDTGSADPRFVEAITAAIQRGDTIALQQLVINSNA